MKKALIIKENNKIIDILNETYDDLFAAVKSRKPNAKSLIEDQEICQLHDVIVLLRLGYLKTYDAESDDGKILKIFEIES